MPLVDRFVRFAATMVLGFFISMIDAIFGLVKRCTGHQAYKIQEEKVLKQFSSNEDYAIMQDAVFGENFRKVMKALQKSPLLPSGRKVALSRLHCSIFDGSFFKNMYTQDPTIKQVELKRPVILIGLQRTGTTLLHRLLGQDPQFYSPTVRHMMPCVDNGHAAWTVSDVYYIMAQRHVHDNLTLPDAPETIYGLMASAGMYGDWRMGVLGTNELEHWIRKMPHEHKVKIYDHVRDAMKCLQKQHGNGKQMLVRHHMNWMLSLESLLEAFPDAILINTVRDPVEHVTSNCSLSRYIANIFWQDVDQPKLGELIVDNMANAANDFAKSCTDVEANILSQSKATLINVYYKDLVKKPIETLEKLYTDAGLPLCAETKSAFQSYLENNPQHKHGKHVYKLSDYGLTADGIRDSFTEYIQYHNNNF